VVVLIYLALWVVAGLGLGWATTLDTPTVVRSGMSLFTDLGLLAGRSASWRARRPHRHAAGGGPRHRPGRRRGRGRVPAARGAAGAARRGVRMAAGMGAVVLFGPVVHPWYLLWAVIPLAATKGLPIYRRTILAASAVLALFVPPTGADFNFRVFQLPLAIVAGLLMLVLLLAFQRYRLAGQQGVDIDALPGHARAEGADAG
jgi:alpha-1,6-mannosyltransferase